MRRKRLDHMDCSIARSLDVVGDPWTVLIVRDALLGVTRFDDFSTRLGVPRATLAARLDALVDAGVMTGERYQDHPPRREYRLTRKGRALLPVVLTLMQWGDTWLRDDDPPTTIVDVDTGRSVSPALVDLASGRPLSELRLRARGEVTTGIRGDDGAASL
jgi:DNA-binding HxlR family transcriptional regulator